MILYLYYTFTNVDLDRAQQLKMKREYTTNDVILRISKILNGEDDYETAMNHALRELSRVLRPDRLYILETDRKTVSNTFEWCAAGVKSELATLQQLDYAKYIGGWERFLETASSVVIDDIEVLKDDDPVDYENLRRQGIERLIATPIYHGGRLIGYLCADNYEWDSRVNTVAVFETVSYFIAAKLANHRLLEELDEAISKTDRRMYRDKVAHYEQVGKKELPRHEFYLTVKKSLQDKVNDVKIE